MANDLNKHIEEIQKQSSDAIDAVEAYRKKQQSEKSRKTAWIILTPIVVIIIAIVIYYAVRNNLINNDIERVLSNPDSVATVTLIGNDQCSVTSNLHILIIQVNGNYFLSPGKTMEGYCEDIAGVGRCFPIVINKNPDNPLSDTIEDREICSH
jgi:hypothetical protein